MIYIWLGFIVLLLPLPPPPLLLLLVVVVWHDNPVLGHCIFTFEASQQYIFLYGHDGNLMVTPHPGGLDLISEFPLIGGVGFTHLKSPSCPLIMRYILSGSSTEACPIWVTLSVATLQVV